MTKKDYLKLAKVFNRSDVLIYLKEHKLLGLIVYDWLTKRLIEVLKADNPKFDADKFMRELEK